ncbi:hypothetical protein L228DRAFT_129527 [Xylona heveae TC161]|uniref:F-box domain-containing protein n=1 Tax=Xylona heveae (strain CBS 132557 / TC161) TaxID=1328760 RepID=A0A165GU51_XYLHT|nr:hypothetical protein L228DRAFT_129527 [Xylona heveae TC161]KZF22601.1 hypothetical protein L228DRAFT_129527 [Xylona heveae TC161]
MEKNGQFTQDHDIAASDALETSTISSNDRLVLDFRPHRVPSARSTRPMSWYAGRMSAHPGGFLHRRESLKSVWPKKVLTALRKTDKEPAADPQSPPMTPVFKSAFASPTSFSGLETLPAKVLGRICGLLPPAENIALKSTCRLLQAGIGDVGYNQLDFCAKFAVARLFEHDTGPLELDSIDDSGKKTQTKMYLCMLCKTRHAADRFESKSHFASGATKGMLQERAASRFCCLNMPRVIVLDDRKTNITDGPGPIPMLTGCKTWISTREPMCMHCGKLLGSGTGSPLEGHSRRETFDSNKLETLWETDAHSEKEESPVENSCCSCESCGVHMVRIYRRLGPRAEEIKISFQRAADGSLFITETEGARAPINLPVCYR